MALATGKLSTRNGGRRVNLALGLLLVVATLTGSGANTIGVDWPIDLIQVHAAAALALLLLAPWKSLVVRRSLSRRRGQPVRWLSFVLLASVLLTIGSGLLHATGSVEHVGPLTLMQIHVGAAVVALLALTGHFRLHPVRPRPTDADRRALLRAAAVGGGAALAVAAWETGLNASGASGGQRRFTGSVEKPRGVPSAMPVTSWFDDRVPRLDADEWRLHVGDSDWDLAMIRALPQESFAATLDCTGGWFAEQDWEGVRLSAVLAAAGVARTEAWRSLEVRSVTGYARWFGSGTLDDVWLVTRVGGAPLSYGHGYPARIVAPGRRGFWWVKWVASLQPSSRPAWVQSVFPLS